MLSIIIPTLNEQEYLPRLLESIKRQSFKDYEIIVADAGSVDGTVEIAKNYGCAVVAGGLPAKGRNEGAGVSRGDLLLFLDADTVLPDDFLYHNLNDFRERGLGVAIFFQEPITDKKIFRFLFILFYDWLALLMSKISLFGGVGILIEKAVHEKIGGWDETSKISEDVLYLKKACRTAPYGILRGVKLLVSVRRYEKEGWFKIFLKHFGGGLYASTLGPVKADIFHYQFGSGKNNDAKKY